MFGESSAIDYFWNNASGGTWNTSTNWNPAGVPTSTDNAYVRPCSLSTTGSFTVTVAQPSQCQRLYVYSEEDKNNNSCDVTFTINAGVTLTTSDDVRFQTGDDYSNYTVNINGTLDCNNNYANFYVNDYYADCDVYVNGLLTDCYQVYLDAHRDTVNMYIQNGGRVSCNSSLYLSADPGYIAGVYVASTAGNPAIEADDEINLSASNCIVEVNSSYSDNIFMGMLDATTGSYYNQYGGVAVVGTSAVSGGFYFHPQIYCSSLPGGRVTFYDLRMYVTPGNSDEIYVNDMTVRNDFDVYRKNTSDGASVEFHSNGDWTTEPCTLAVGNSFHCHSGVILEFWNTGGVITHYGAGYYSITLDNGVKTYAGGENQRLIFEYLDTSGMTVNGYGVGTFDGDNNLDYTTFQHGQAGGTYLTMNYTFYHHSAGDSLVFYNVNFENGPTYNVYRDGTAYTNVLTFNGGTGGLWGESYDHDPTDTPGIVHWLMAPAPPGAAYNFSGTALNCSTIVWTWTDTISNEDGFRIYDDSAVLQGSVGANITSWTEYDIFAGDTNIRYVVPYNTEGDGPQSNRDTVITQECIIWYISVWNHSKVESLQVIAQRDAQSGSVVKIYVPTFAGDSTIGAADIVDTTDTDASAVRIFTPAGIKSWRKK